ncbi:amidohydrolase family protein [Kribbella sp. NPDC059898]|uniref:amidohydrolase family protein n=1 Tax=Kribbella sp. NPDC059898 TaxID=3346995 RepID=UPI00365A6063
MTTTVVANAQLLERAGLADLTVTDGVITQVAPATGTRRTGTVVDAAGGLVCPSFVDAHFHPDKALTFPRLGPVGNTSMTESMARGAAVKSEFTHDDVVRRAGLAIEAAVGNGVGAVRAQVDVDSSVGLTGLEALLEVRAAYSAQIDIQLVAFPQEGIVRDPGAVPLLRKALELGADLIGGGPDNEGDPAAYRAHLDTVFGLATEFGVDVDIHADMSEVPSQRALELVAEQTIARGLHGRVNAVHCCALAAYPQEHAAEVIALVAEAGMQICICPIGNLQLVGEGTTPRGRGASRPKELLAAGVNVAAGTDNLHDMWFRFGNLDPVETCLITCLSAALRTDAEVHEGFAMVTTRAAQYLGLTKYGVQEGDYADLVVFSHSNLNDVIRGLPGTRRTFKRGTLVATRTTTVT